MPDMDVTDVSTVISDSGVTRYRISAPRWLVYNKAKAPYWLFPQGLKLENFDENLHVYASIRANYARYDANNQIWRLQGDVEAMNTQGEIFKTPVLFWNQYHQTVYSDTVIDIITHGSTLHGHGFVSNQELTKYTIQSPTGSATETNIQQ